MSFLTINGVSSLDYGVRISGGGTYGSPDRDVEEVSIPGRNGTLLIDNGRFENIEVKYPAYIPDKFPEKMARFRAFMGTLTGFKRLEDTYHAEFFRLASFSKGLSPKTTPLNRGGEFDITFTCKPQRWLKVGENEVIPGGLLYNPTLYPSKPKIRLYGKGTLTIGEYEMTVDPLYPNEYIDIDCDLMNASYGAVNFNNYISGQFPVLEPGDNEIEWTGDSLTIIPRWWTI